VEPMRSHLHPEKVASIYNIIEKVKNSDTEGLDYSLVRTISSSHLSDSDSEDLDNSGQILNNTEKQPKKPSRAASEKLRVPRLKVGSLEEFTLSTKVTGNKMIRISPKRGSPRISPKKSPKRSPKDRLSSELLDSPDRTKPKRSKSATAVSHTRPMSRSSNNSNTVVPEPKLEKEEHEKHAPPVRTLTASSTGSININSKQLLISKRRRHKNPTEKKERALSIQVQITTSSPSEDPKKPKGRSKLKHQGSQEFQADVHEKFFEQNIMLSRTHRSNSSLNISSSHESSNKKRSKSKSSTNTKFG